VESGLRQIPLAFDGGGRSGEHFGGFFDGQTAKETQFDEPALLLVNRRQTGQGIIECDELFGSFRVNSWFLWLSARVPMS